jgi:hypothetical protein
MRSSFAIASLPPTPFQRLQVKVLKRVDVSYGGENGFNQAIELAAETLGDVKFIQEKKLICRERTAVDLCTHLCRLFSSLFR